MKNTSSRVYEVRRVFNDKRQMIAESYYDDNGAPMVNGTNIAGFARTYDENGNLVISKENRQSLKEQWS